MGNLFYQMLLSTRAFEITHTTPLFPVGKTAKPLTPHKCMLATNPACIAVLPQVSLILFYYIYGTCLPHFQFIYIKRRKNIRCFKKFVRRISKNIRSFYPKRTENFGEGGKPVQMQSWILSLLRIQRSSR